MKTWRLKKGADRRFRSGHPWVFASELAHSAKEIAPGELVELRDSSEHFLAYGYAHPTSQISFRRLSSRAKDQDLLTPSFFLERLKAASLHRQAAGWNQFSHRWLFGEADGVPGLVVDAYRTTEKNWVVVAQASTAGMDRALSALFEALTTCAPEGGALTLVEAPNSRNRKLEGLEVGDKKVVHGPSAEAFSCEIELTDGLPLKVDLMHGQKTGFFLDQQWNTHLLRRILRERARFPGERLKVLDICCYVGQWGAQAAHGLMASGRLSSVSLVDSSESALSFAEANVGRFASEVNPICADVLKVLGTMEPESFDVVICDPPAFVKKKTDLEAGLRAYTKLNRDALKLLKPGGVFVASSCSGLVRGEDWRTVLAEASLKSGRILRQIFPGGHGPDHPVRPEFPEGEYLKCGFYSAGLRD